MSNTVIHELKTWPEYYEAIIAGTKTFEIREDDRGFAVGHFLKLREWDPRTANYTGRVVGVQVLYLTKFLPGLKDGFVAMGLGSLP